MMKNSELKYRPYIEPLIDELNTRSQRSALGLLGLANRPLRTFLGEQMTKTPGEIGSLLADPVFEPTYGWQESQETMRSLRGSLLNERLLESMSAPPSRLADDYTFPLDRSPYAHQLQSWKMLSTESPQSLVVTSGTGSGKTECFLVPILNRLATQSKAEGRLQGVRALFIYPLNALISSQQNRLDAWTHGFQGDVRYCLYTGDLPNKEKATKRQYDGQVIDRAELRAHPAPMLITNATMLEYMLIRKEDEPILAQSRGKLEWIVLDEAHTYIGSQAAEMALLLRRAMLAFGVEPQNVRFVATSATFGMDSETSKQLQNFLSDMAGVSPDQVHVIHGSRQIPPLRENVDYAFGSCSVEEIRQIAAHSEQSVDRYTALERHPTARSIREAFIHNGSTSVQKLSQLAARFNANGIGPKSIIQWLDLMSGTRGADGQAFLPLRIHLFHNVLSGVRACVDPECSVKKDATLCDPDWRFGMIYTGDRTHCDCGAPILPVSSCTECSEIVLMATITSDYRLIELRREDDDEFALDSELPQDENDPDSKLEESDVDGLERAELVTNKVFDGRGERVWLDRISGRKQKNAPLENGIEVVTYAQDNVQACPCCQSESPRHGLFRRIGVGAPFTLSTVISTLLEFCPDDPDAPGSKPFRGRKMISFTDSRQGTARIAVKLQQDSERSRIRALIYHHLIKSRGVVKLTSEQEQDLSDLLEDQKTGPLSPREQRHLDFLLKARESEEHCEISWGNLRLALASEVDVQTSLLDYYHSIAPKFFQKDTGASALANMLLVREFARRPKNQNSTESMGLVTLAYPQLESITVAPIGWPGTLATWHNFLKTLIDFYIRENSFLQIDESMIKYIGMRIRPKWLIAPSSKEQNESRRKRWPQVSHGSKVQSRPVNLLTRSLGWHHETHEDQINFTLVAAWNDLVKCRLLDQADSGFRLKLEDVVLRSPRHLGICPITRRFIDDPFGGVSPYSSPQLKDGLCKVTAAKMPIYPYPFGKGLDPQERIELARAWLAAEPEVQTLRAEGLWSNLHDRIIEGGVFFRTAEHSAQQPRSRLSLFEQQFKAGRINVMNCSTTMEMGVDIGGISIVAMNNVPPHPANYLQRAGRAGRRREGRSVALTVCKNTSHDQNVFCAPSWPFDTTINVPRVSLQSPDLVLRHFNAYLLSYWLKHIVRADEIKTMTCGAFFKADQSNWSVAKRFMAWCKHPEKNLSTSVRQDLQHLLKRTALAGMPLGMLVTHTEEQMAEITEAWLNLYQSVCQQQEEFAGSKETNPAYKALQIQILRIDEEYLLSELANQRFLPGYGFPTGVVPFDNRCWSTTAEAVGNPSREDNRGRYRQLASRERPVALREYAPGSDVVMNGLVYRSGGITLNWHVPAAETDIKEAQLFKFAWRCRHCGSSGTVMSKRPEQCLECGHSLDGHQQVRQYLVPSGFAVDFFDEPHNDISTQTYVPVKQPWLNIDELWIPLANPASGKFRVSPRASLFHYTGGAYGEGFAVCLECGRAEPMLKHPDQKAALNEQKLSPVFRSGSTHRRLRGSKDEKGSRTCPGSDSAWKIKQHVFLGHDALTDAIEVVLTDPLTGKYLHNEIAAYSIAVALRAAIAAKLGVQEEELGCATKPILNHGQQVTVIQVFDQRSGGYSSLAAELVQTQDFWYGVRSKLDCVGECTSACQHCLLGFDTRFSADRLDRFAGLAILTEEWIRDFEVRSEHRAFGTNTRPESTTLLGAIERELQKAGVSAVRVYWQGSPEQWDIAVSHPLLEALIRWKASGLNVEIWCCNNNISGMHEVDRFKLASLVDMGAQYAEVSIDAMISTTVGMPLVAAVENQHGWRAWANTCVDIALPGPSWGTLDDGQVLVMGSLECPPNLSLKPFTANDIRPYTGSTEVEFSSELNGRVSGFGSRLWQMLCEQSSRLNEILNDESYDLTEISYSDRYLRTPLSLGLLVSMLYALKNLPVTSKSNQKVAIHTVSTMGTPKYAGTVGSDWTSNVERDQSLLAALEFCGFNAQVCSDNPIDHGRSLVLTFRSGLKIVIRFDQGMGYWFVDKKAGSSRFDFSDPATLRGERLTDLPCSIVHPHFGKSQIFISIK
jgi:DEAD/DEAH box helicase domain-containing protein